MVVGTVGTAVPEEVLVAAGAEVVPVTGEPGGATDLADRYVEPMVGKRARSQLQRLLDGTYAGLDLLLCSREEESTAASAFEMLTSTSTASAPAHAPYRRS